MRILKGTILLVFVCVFIRIAVGKPCVVPSGSMEPTLLCGDRLWINKLAYGGRLPKRWADIPLLNVFTWIRPLRITEPLEGFPLAGVYPATVGRYCGVQQPYG